MNAVPADTAQSGSRAGLKWSGLIIGLAMGGFFDGILLHQVLQWHHFLSGVRSPAVQDLRVQILADGLFHVAMYLVGGLGLLLLWRARRWLGLVGSGRLLIGAVLVGFGAWQFLDVILAHWVLGIHRIRMDTQSPLLWDLGWLVVLGPPPILAGWLVWRRLGELPASGHVAAAAIVLLLVTAAPISALPPSGQSDAIVLFRPGLSPAEIMGAVAVVGGKMIWADASGDVWAIGFDDPARARELYGRGALLVSTSFSPAGCLSWSRTL